MRKQGGNEMLNLKELLGDGAYDSLESFEYLRRRGLDPPGIRIRENASRKGLSDCVCAVRERDALGYEE